MGGGRTRLSSLLPPVQGKDRKEVKEETAEERLRRRAYERGCQRLKKRIEGQACRGRAAGRLGGRAAGRLGGRAAGLCAHVCLGRGRARAGLRVPGGGAPSQPAPLLPRGPRAGLCGLSVRSPPAQWWKNCRSRS